MSQANEILTTDLLSKLYAKDCENPTIVTA